MIQKRFTINGKSLLIAFVVFILIIALEPFITKRTLPEALNLPIIILGLLLGYTLFKRLTFPEVFSKYLYPIWNTLFFTYFFILYAFTDFILTDPISSWDNLWILVLIIIVFAILIWSFSLLDERRLRRKTAFESKSPIILSSKAKLRYLADQHPDPGRLILQENSLWFVRKYGEPIKMEFEKILELNIEYRFIFFMPVLVINKRRQNLFLLQRPSLCIGKKLLVNQWLVNNYSIPTK